MIDVSEIRLYKSGLLQILLLDNTRLNNILWLTDIYDNVNAQDEIFPEQILTDIIKPRFLKNKEEKNKRTKEKAEVFTSTEICKKQNDLVSNNLKYNTMVLEIACGEAPYLVSRYDTVTGAYNEIEYRVGLLDRKLSSINENTTLSINEWFKKVKIAYQTTYGYEWQGDSLLLARENLLYTFIDNYIYMFNSNPPIEMLKEIAEIISWNIFQMDGLKYTIPLTDIFVRIKDWEKNEILYFKDLV